MADKSKKDKKKKSWAEGLKAEFAKIIWPTQDTLIKQTMSVTVASVALGVIIAIIDFVVQYGIDFLMKL